MTNWFDRPKSVELPWNANARECSHDGRFSLGRIAFRVWEVHDASARQNHSGKPAFGQGKNHHSEARFLLGHSRVKTQTFDGWLRIGVETAANMYAQEPWQYGEPRRTAKHAKYANELWFRVFRG